jgi:hypothetical protein
MNSVCAASIAGRGLAGVLMRSVRALCAAPPLCRPTEPGVLWVLALRRPGVAQYWERAGMVPEEDLDLCDAFDDYDDILRLAVR